MTDQNWKDLLRTASELRSAGRVPEAIEAYKAVLALKPELPDSWYNLGFLQKQARAFGDSLRSYDRALALGISQPEEVHLNRAVILADHLHRSDEAERELRAALNRNPQYVPALLNLGNLFEDLGNRCGARKAYERALAVDPDSSLALARLAVVSLAVELDSGLAERLRRKIADPRISAADQADLGFALAALLDACGRYDEAFEAARAANRASRTASGVSYEREAVEGFADASIAAFDRPIAPATDVGAPVFICGMFRSGSSLVEQILGCHSGIQACGEIDALPILVRGIPGYPATVAAADRQQKSAWRDAYLRTLPPTAKASKSFTDKRPDNFLHIGFIKALFPAAKIVHTYRAPLDNLLSLYFLHLDPSMAYAQDLSDAAHWYAQYQRLMAHWKAVYPNDIFDVDYDLLVREPRLVIAQILEFLGLSWEERVLDFHRRRASVKTASVWQVREPIHTRSSGRWRNYERHLFELWEALQQTQSL